MMLWGGSRHNKKTKYGDNIGKKKKKKGKTNVPSRPLWFWILVFLLPLIASELMFYVAGRWGSMILFLVAWVGFWVAILHRSGWAIFKRQENAQKARGSGRK
ncbi:MAG: hypothetical protein H5T61_07415 [Thermoflexales bacterium]|nr:hypothetical protein [Thermoflexales bacterium]